MRQLLILLSFIIFSTYTNAQSGDNKPIFHTIEIFKSSMVDGKTRNISIKIDSTGNVEYNKLKKYSKVNMYLLKAGFSKFIISEKLELLPADDEPPVMMPNIKNGEQYINLEFTVYNSKEEGLANKTRYEWRKVYNASVKEVDFYKFLDKKNLKIIKQLLD